MMNARRNLCWWHTQQKSANPPRLLRLLKLLLPRLLLLLLVRFLEGSSNQEPDDPQTTNRRVKEFAAQVVSVFMDTRKKTMCYIVKSLEICILLCSSFLITKIFEFTTLIRATFSKCMSGSGPKFHCLPPLPLWFFEQLHEGRGVQRGGLLVAVAACL